MAVERFRQVGEVAKEVGVSASRIRLWEAEGLLRPRRTSSGHRVFSKADADRLRELKRLIDDEGWSAAAIKANLNAHFPDTVSPANAIGERIRDLRMSTGWSLRELSDKSGVAASTLSSIERGQSMPTVGSLHKLSRAFETTLSRLLQAPEPAASPVVRKNERVLLPMQTPGLAWEKLYTRDSVLESLMVTLQPGAGTDTPLQHHGEEFVYVLKGSIELVLDGHVSFLLSAGDAMTFDSMREHSYVNPGRTVAQSLWVNTPPNL